MFLQGNKAASMATHKLYTIIMALWPCNSGSELFELIEEIISK